MKIEEFCQLLSQIDPPDEVLGVEWDDYDRKWMLQINGEVSIPMQVMKDDGTIMLLQGDYAGVALRRWRKNGI
jgi:hypothetical protein